MSEIDLLLGTVFLGLASIMLLVSVLSYRRHPGRKLALVSGSYFLFTVLAAVVLLSPFLGWQGTIMSADLILFSIGILLLQYLSLL